MTKGGHGDRTDDDSNALVSQKLLVIGLDAVEAPLVQELMADGHMPNLAAIAANGVSRPVQTTCMDTLPGAIWQDIFTGRSAGDHADYYPERLHTGDAEPRPIDPSQHGGTYVWDRAAERGIASIVVDPPLGSTYEGISDLVTLVCEWHVHDSNYGRVSHPLSLMAELEARYGTRPVDRCDMLIDGTNEAYAGFIDHLEREATVKGEMVADLLTNRPWQLGFIGMSQGHCAGHQLWQFHDAQRAGRDDGGLGDGVRRVYRSLDQALGRILDAAPGDVDVVVFTSHGMENYVGGPQLLPDVLRALDFGDPRKVPGWLRPLVPSKSIHRVFDRFPVLLRATDKAGAFRPVVDESVKALTVRNNRCGAIRLNIEGREPDGAVAPDDVESLTANIVKAIESLRHPDSGEPIVQACHRARDVFGPDHHPDIPDLMIAFRQDLGLLDAAESELIGRIERPVWTKRAHRTGDHTDASHLWASVQGGDDTRFDGLTSLDLAPLILDLLSAETAAS